MEGVKKCLRERNVDRVPVYVHHSPPKPVRDAACWRGGRRPAAGGWRRRCEELHAAVRSGSLLQLQELLEGEYNKNKAVCCLSEDGAGLLHTAVHYGFVETARFLVQLYPHLVHQRDAEGRTALHYAAAAGRRGAELEALLEAAGAARGLRDCAGRTPASYHAARATLDLPALSEQPTHNQQGLVVKRHNIRIWCHDCDMARLQRIVWEGHGSKLLSEVSNQPVVKRFLEAVPYMMNTIRDIHNAVVQNDLEDLMRLTADPVPPQILSSRDTNNMTSMHKAAGLGHVSIMKYIADRFPQGINDVDNDGRTPLHYAAIVKDEQHTFKTLVGLGADESATDNKNRTPGYYVNRPQDIDKSLLKIVPEAPRTPSSAYPSTWDWNILDSHMAADFNKKCRKKKGSNDNSKTNTNTISESAQNITTMKSSSTQEHIQNLPDLEDNLKLNENGIELYDVINHEELKLTQDEDKTNDVENKLENLINLEDQSNEDEPQNESQKKMHDESLVNEEDENGKEFHDGKAYLEDTTKSTDNESSFKDNPTKNLEKIHDNLEQNPVEKQKELESENQGDLQNNTNLNTTQELDNDSPEDLQREFNNKNNELNDEPKENDEAENVSGIDTIEGNNTEIQEDDDDVQVQGDSESEYSDTNLKSTAEANTPGSAKRGTDADNGRNTQQSLIEGIISAEPETDSQDASDIQRHESLHADILTVDNEIDPEVTELINDANMEMLATLVLNGEGSRLVGRRSGNLELQAFLDNVPIYMQKINKVHVAAREGNIRDLQSALDRRKFAIARDPISPNGATPLHVATMFGKTNIIKYLGGRFPETLSAVDFEGRTALHYAAALPDNGHYFHLLQQLGANSKDLDDNGKSAENYQDDRSLLPYKQLLQDFGISDETAHQMLSDKVPEDRVSSRRTLVTPEALDTLERCYKLLAAARPPRTPLSASSNKSTPPLVLGRFLRKSTFENVKDRITKLDHDLFDVIWPAVKKLPESRNIVQTVEEDFPGGVTAPDYYIYEVFSEFLTPLIKDIHNINVTADLPSHPPSDFAESSHKTVLSVPLLELNIDTTEEYVLSGTIECSRNIKGFELPINLKIGELETIERIVTTVLMKHFNEQENPKNIKLDQKAGTYYTLNEVLEKPSEVCATLASSNLLVALCDREDIDDCTRLHGRHWPYGRGVLLSEDKSVAVWVNVHDHIRVIISTSEESPGEIGLPFSKMTYIMTYLHEELDFVWDHILGHLSSRPTFLGAGIRFSLVINFPGLSKDPDNMKHLCAMRGLQYRETLSKDIARVSNYQCLSLTESNCFNDFTTATSNLLHLERDISMQSSAHITSMLSNIFKKKKSSLVEMDTEYTQ